MSPKAKHGYKAPRDRREVWTAVVVAVAIVVATGVLVWFVRPNKDSGSSTTVTTATTAPAATSTTVPGATDTTAAPADTTTPAASTPATSTP